MKALVTGATGFIGSHLVEFLVQRGAQVKCLVRNKRHLGWVKDSPVEFIVGNCQEKNSLKQSVKDVDHVFHLAGATTAVKEKAYFEVNALGTENLVQACIENNTRLKKFIYLSSQAAAGPCLSGGKKKESDPCKPVSPYGKSKLLGEQLALSHSHEIPLLILRPCAVYGPRDKGFYALFKCLSKGIQPCFSGRDQHISMCYVQDLVRAILLAAETQTENGEIFFLSDGQDYRMEEICDIFAQAMEISALRLRLPKQVLFGMAFFAECFSRVSGKPSIMSRGKVAEMIQKNWLCDIAKGSALLGFEPRVSLAQGAELAVAWYKKENWL
ncbi:MAG: NAD(P)-dependent oxidoreductase [Desulfobulbaceae bacterium]|nr:NAD(P)-dependent oxidoreductase [Desulfobulbaceae bacterium]